MPGYVVHMAVASKILEEKGITNSSFQNAFLLGNIVPDAMDRNLKKESHFWDDVTYKNLNRIPNLDNFMKKYGDKLGNPFVLGYYSHLLLDNLFVTEYWEEHFDLLDENMNKEKLYDKVKYIRTHDVVYSRGDFFSDELYYGDYDRLYSYIFEEWPFISVTECNLKVNTIEELNSENNKAMLIKMLEKVNHMYIEKEKLVKQELKIFDIKHIYKLMEKTVSNVCKVI